MEINDTYVLEHCLKSNMTVCSTNISPEIHNYLKSRYSDIPEDLYSDIEVIKRILFNIDERPLCANADCRKPVSFIGRSRQLFMNCCCKKCADKLNGEKTRQFWERADEEKRNEIRSKKEQTNLAKYGVKCYMQTDEFKTTANNTRLEKYGDANYGKIGSEAFKQNMIEKYGSEYPSSNENVRTKISKSRKSDESRQKGIETCLSIYGTEFASQSLLVKNKVEETMSKNKTHKTSKDEYHLYSILLGMFDEHDIIRWHKSEQYPFNCDFYIKSLDLYIEYQGSMFHNSCVFDASIDSAQLDIIKAKCGVEKHNIYDSIVDTWTIRDVNKLNYAKEHDVNLLLVYPKFHKNWGYFKDHPDNQEIKNEVINYLKEIAYNLKGVKTIGEERKWKLN